jgi:hypothetical protein
VSEKEGEITLGGHPFKLAAGSVPRRIDQERYPGRIITGNLGASDEVKAPAWVMQDFSGGQGVYLMDPDTQMDRYWVGLGDFRSTHFGSPACAYDAAGGDYTALAEYGGAIYGFDTHAWKRDDAANTWADKGALAGGALAGPIEYKGKLYVACGSSGYSYSADGATWSNVAGEATISFCIFDGNLVKIDGSGNIETSTDGTTWTAVLTMTYPAGYYSHLFVFFNNAGDPCIYVSHKRGFDWIDIYNKKAFPTGLILPKHPYGGKAAGVWRGDYAFYSAGLSAYGYTPGNVREIGLDRDDGVSSEMRGNLVDMASGHMSLYAGLDNTSALAAAPLAGHSTRWRANAPKIMGGSVGYSFIMEYNGSGWQAKWQSASQALPMRCLLISDAYDYRLWWVADGHVWYMKRPLGVTDPKMVMDSEYADAAYCISSWFRGGSAVDAKAALMLSTTVENLAAYGSLTISYGLDGSEAWTQIGVYTADNIPDILFLQGEGLEFERIRFKIELNGKPGRIKTVGGWIIAIKLRYRHALPKLRTWAVTIDCTAEYGGLQPRQQLALLSEYSASRVLVPFMFEWPEVVYWVDVNLQGQESTGRLRKSQYQVMLSECV